jgi:hypothetical protein
VGRKETSKKKIWGAPPREKKKKKKNKKKFKKKTPPPPPQQKEKKRKGVGSSWPGAAFPIQANARCLTKKMRTSSTFSLAVFLQDISGILFCIVSDSLFSPQKQQNSPGKIGG